MQREPLSTIGPFRILGVLGQGGMGVVYRAEHVETGEPAAVKTVRLAHASMLSSFRREIQALSRIRHPNVVRILAEGTQDGVPWYAMEMLRGVTLRGLTEAVTDEPMRSTVRWDATQTAAGPAAPDTDPSEPSGDSTLVDPAPEGATCVPHELLETVLVDGRPPGPGAPVDRRRPLGLAHALRLVRRLCGALAYLHGEGIVHRDLKPDNVFVVDGGDRPVLVDFGLATQFGGRAGREALEVGRNLVGTIAYIAPEQARGELVDARADLYALGCILYELVTGRPPFLEATVDAVVAAHLVEPPLAPSRRAAGVPPALDALVLRLLAKRPGDRIGYAADVAAAIDAIAADWPDAGPSEGSADSQGNGAEPAAGSVADEPSAASPVPRSYVYRPGFVGRDASLASLRRRVASLRSARGCIVLVGGESGVGKTRFAVELGREAEAARVRVLTGECLPGAKDPDSDASATAAGGAPLQGLRRPLEAIGDLCRERGSWESDRIFGARGKLLASYVPALEKLPGQEDLPEPAELAPAAARQRLFRYLAQVFEALTADEPAALIVDDLQWADELTLGFLEFLAAGDLFDRAQLLVVATYRSEEVGERLAALARAPGVENVELGRLGPEAVAAMVGDMLALAAPPERLAAFVEEQSEGNPFFVAEYLRAAVEEGFLVRDAGGHWRVAGDEASAADYARLGLPVSLRDVVDRRLRGLPPNARAVVGAASVVGREAPTDLLVQTTGLAEADVLAAVTELLRRQTVEEPRPGVVRFAHDKVREVAYAEIPEGERARLHRAAAVALEATGDGAPAVLATHWDRAGEPARAKGYYLAGAVAARSRHALVEAERLYRSFLALAKAGDGGEAGARAGLADVVRILGRPAEALPEAAEAERLARAAGDLATETDAVQTSGNVHLDTGRLDEARERFGRALALAREAGDTVREARALSSMAGVAHVRGAREEARALYREAVARAREAGDRRTEGIALSNFALLHQELGNVDRARELFAYTLALHRETGNRAAEGVVAMNLGVLAKEQGRAAEALAHYNDALAVAREVGDRRSEGMTLVNIGSVHEDAGRDEEARATYERALAINRATGSRRFEGIALCNLGNVASYQGRLGDARELFAEALAINREVGDRKFEGITLGDMGDLERRSGDFDRAEELLEESEAALAETGSAYYLALAACRRGFLRLARGLSAAEQIAAARARVEESAIDPANPVARSLAALEGAEARRGEGLPLVRGEDPTSMPPLLLRALLWEERGAE